MHVSSEEFHNTFAPFVYNKNGPTNYRFGQLVWFCYKEKANSKLITIKAGFFIRNNFNPMFVEVQHATLIFLLSKKFWCVSLTTCGCVFGGVWQLWSDQLRHFIIDVDCVTHPFPSSKSKAWFGSQHAMDLFMQQVALAHVALV